MGADDEVRDWHYSSMNWEHPFMLDTVSSPFGGWGVRSLSVPGHGVMPVADHVRACLDLIEQGGMAKHRECVTITYLMMRVMISSWQW